MDAIGAAASILQFSSCAVKFFQTARALYDGRNEFALDQKALELSVSQFKMLAAALPPVASSSKTDQVDVAKMLEDCHDIATKLLTQLDKFKGQKKSFIWSLRKAVTVMWTKEEVDGTLTRLDRHIQVLNLYMASCGRGKLDAIQNTTASTEVMVSQLVEWKNEFQASQLNMERESKEYDIKAKQRDIIKSLALGHTNQRYMDISDAFESTYDWILSEDLSAQGNTGSSGSSQGDSNSEPSSKRPSCDLKSWLTSGNGIFHILGKPGSGKSTLMKFICDDPRTAESLTTWARPNELVVSHFFFWRHGHIHQRKVNGLRRTLLASVLSQIPEEIPHLFPDLWGRLDGGSVEENVQITDREIRDAFDFMIKRAGSIHNAGYRFCFFIDGLDEFQEDLDFQYRHLADSLRKWVSESCGTIKMCVSSRELPDFQDQLSSAQQNQIHLQHLTERDIKSLVHHTLRRDPYFRRLEKADPEECQNFISEFVFRSEGVFLWVKLVLPKITRALVSRSTFGKLCRIINTIPNELEDFFKEILDSIRDQDEEEVYSIFGLLRLETTVGHVNTFSLLSYSFVTELLESDDPDYVAKYDIPNHDEEDLRLRLEDASVRLRGDCCGLVELRPNSTLSDFFPHLSKQVPTISQHLTFTHRTIPEFLQKMAEDPKAKDKPYLQEQSVIRLAIQKLILRVKAIPFPEVPNQSGSSSATPIWKKMFNFTRGLTLDIQLVLLAIDQMSTTIHQGEFFSLLDLLDEALCARQPWITKKSTTRRLTSLDLDWTRLHPVQPFSFVEELEGRYPVVSVLHMAVAHGPSEYVWWRIAQREPDGAWLDYSPNRTEIFNTITRNTFPSSGITVSGAIREPPTFVILEGLFDRGLSVYDNPVFTKGYHNNEDEEVHLMVASLWFDVIWSVLCLEPSETDDIVGESASASTTGGKKEPVKRDRDWDLFERFLKHGADPAVYFEELEPLKDQEWTDQGYIYSDNDDFLNGDLGVMTLPGDKFLQFLSRRPDRTCCLRDFVEFMRPWNCESILTIIDDRGKSEELEESRERC